MLTVLSANSPIFLFYFFLELSGCLIVLSEFFTWAFFSVLFSRVQPFLFESLFHWRPVSLWSLLLWLVTAITEFSYTSVAWRSVGNLPRIAQRRSNCCLLTNKRIIDEDELLYFAGDLTWIFTTFQWAVVPKYSHSSLATSASSSATSFCSFVSC